MVWGVQDFGFGCRDIISVLENHMEKNLENEMSIGIISQQFRLGFWDLLQR